MFKETHTLAISVFRGMLDKLIKFFGLAMEMLNFALSAGSSKHGKAYKKSNN